VNRIEERTTRRYAVSSILKNFQSDEWAVDLGSYCLEIDKISLECVNFVT
jgi:hypothetical protein